MRNAPFAMFFALASAAMGLAGCRDDPQAMPPWEGPASTRLLPDDDGEGVTFSGCLYASPLLTERSEGKALILLGAEGELRAIDPGSFETLWSTRLPVPDGQTAYAIATPVIADGRVFVAYQSLQGNTRQHHYVVAVSVETGALDAQLPQIELEASKPSFDGEDEVQFLPSNALSRSTLVHGKTAARPEGFVYVAYGNARDIQPWHGWVFELDIQAWRESAGDNAQSAVLLTTPEEECPEEGTSGSRDMICGGGVWAPSGPLLVANGDESSFELFVPTGNGLLDISRNDYANTIMRTGPGLAFVDGCDVDACSDFDITAPSTTCLDSCAHVFAPRLLPESAPLRPSSGVCDDLTFMECYARLDYDLGANTPSLARLASGKRVMVLPAKDGAVYLFDGDHLGTLYHRKVIMDQCGTPTSPCLDDWAGTMVTQPQIVQSGGKTIALIATFIRDGEQPAGIVALEIIDEDSPRLEVMWRAPDFSSSYAQSHFRHWPSRIAITELGGETYALVVDVGVNNNTRGSLFMIRVSDGQWTVSSHLWGRGRRYIQPVIDDGKLYTTSCRSNDGPGRLEIFALESAAP